MKTSQLRHGVGRSTVRPRRIGTADAPSANSPASGPDDNDVCQRATERVAGNTVRTSPRRRPRICGIGQRPRSPAAKSPSTRLIGHPGDQPERRHQRETDLGAASRASGFRLPRRGRVHGPAAQAAGQYPVEPGTPSLSWLAYSNAALDKPCTQPGGVVHNPGASWIVRRRSLTATRAHRAAGTTSPVARCRAMDAR